MQPSSVLNIDDELFAFAPGVRTLTPAQQNAADELASGLAAADVNVLRVASGMGRTTIMRSVHAHSGGTFVAARQFVNLLSKRVPGSVEETFLELLTATLSHSPIVFVDDLHLVTGMLTQYKPFYALMTALLDEAARHGKKLVFASNPENKLPDSHRAIVWEMQAFESADYACIAEYYLGSAAARLDMAKVHHFAPALTVYQIKNACLWLGLRYAAPDTDSLIEYLRSHNISNQPDRGAAKPLKWSTRARTHRLEASVIFIQEEEFH